MEIKKFDSAHQFAQFVIRISYRLHQSVINISPRSATVLTPPALTRRVQVFKNDHKSSHSAHCALCISSEALEQYLLSAEACAGADGTQVLLLPLVSHLVHFAIVIAH